MILSSQHLSILQQLKQRRLELGLKQNDMMLRVGISRQQYHRLESKGNPRLDTLELVAKGLNTRLLLVPQEKLSAVLAVLDDSYNQAATSAIKKPRTIADDPWQGFFEDDA